MKKSVHGRADHWDLAGAGSWVDDGGRVPQARHRSATFYKWKAKFGGSTCPEAQAAEGAGDKNAKLKKLLAEAMLDNAMLKDIASKKW